MKKQNKIKIIIIVLAVLLALSLAALAVTLIYNSLHDDTHATVTVPDNLITPEFDASGDETSAPTEGTSESGDGETSADKTNEQIKPKPPLPHRVRRQKRKKRPPSSCLVSAPRKTHRFRLEICSPATAKRNISVCGYPITMP